MSHSQSPVLRHFPGKGHAAGKTCYSQRALHCSGSPTSLLLLHIGILSSHVLLLHRLLLNLGCPAPGSSYSSVGLGSWGMSNCLCSALASCTHSGGGAERGRLFLHSRLKYHDPVVHKAGVMPLLCALACLMQASEAGTPDREVFRTAFIMTLGYF